MRKLRPRKADKRLMRMEMHQTVPPRMEGKAKNAMMNPVRKKKQPRKKTASKKRQGYSAAERKSYQLRSARH